MPRARKHTKTNKSPRGLSTKCEPAEPNPAKRPAKRKRNRQPPWVDAIRRLLADAVPAAALAGGIALLIMESDAGYWLITTLVVGWRPSPRRRARRALPATEPRALGPSSDATPGSS